MGSSSSFWSRVGVTSLALFAWSVAAAGPAEAQTTLIGGLGGTEIGRAHV
jgi:hypothetical protein